MYKKRNGYSSGFTIIEVALVLAIAALIFLVVFLAVPALQRNQRDNARKQDVATAATIWLSWVGNEPSFRLTSSAADRKKVFDRFGAVEQPASGNEIQNPMRNPEFAQLDSLGLSINYNVWDPDDKEEFNVLNRLRIFTKVHCDPEKTNSEKLSFKAASMASAAIITRLEAGGNAMMYYCQNV